MKKNDLVQPWNFFLLTFFLSWLIWIPLVLSRFHFLILNIPEDASRVLGLLGVLMPAISAILLARIITGSHGIKILFSGFLRWQIDLKWWAAALILQPTLLVLAGLSHNLLGSQTPVLSARAAPAATVLVNGVFLLIATLGEEIGWRGLALPALQSNYSPLKSSLILAFFWGLWHIPFWLLQDTFLQFGAGYLMMNILLGIPMTIIITWFYNHGNQSLLLPVGFHLVFNLINVLWLPVTLSIRAFWIFIALEWLLALIIMDRLIPSQSRSNIPQV